MATLSQVRNAYLQHDQATIDHAWSARWGGTHHQWGKTIYPRICRFLPCRSILEIGCGRGILSKHLMHYTKNLTLVDFINTEPLCRLQDTLQNTQVEFHLNDGLTLNAVEDNSIEFVFSFFSLIDADYRTIESYIKEIDRILTADGAAFIHHSNACPESENVMPEHIWDQVRAVRAEDVNARLVSIITKECNLEPRIQECVAWVHKNFVLDCFTTLVRPSNTQIDSVGQFNNTDFDEEICSGISNLSSVYGQKKVKPYIK